MDGYIKHDLDFGSVVDNGDAPDCGMGTTREPEVQEFEMIKNPFTIKFWTPRPASTNITSIAAYDAPHAITNFPVPNIAQAAPSNMALPIPPQPYVFEPESTRSVQEHFPKRADDNPRTPVPDVGALIQTYDMQRTRGTEGLGAYGCQDPFEPHVSTGVATQQPYHSEDPFESRFSAAMATQQRPHHSQAQAMHPVQNLPVVRPKSKSKGRPKPKTKSKARAKAKGKAKITVASDDEDEEQQEPLHCILDFAGCKATFTTKNEHKRHIVSQHLNIEVWICTIDNCSIHHSTEHYAEKYPLGHVFNRKDLYVPHLNRLHRIKGVSKEEQRWKKYVSDLCTVAETQNRDPPAKVRCPVEGCGEMFEGKKCCDALILHAADHMLKHPSGHVYFQEEDELFMKWAEENEVVWQDEITQEWRCHMEPPNSRKGSARQKSVVPSEHREELGEVFGEDIGEHF